MKKPDIDTGYRVTGEAANADILTPRSTHSGYYISGERILCGNSDTGYYVSGEIVYGDPATDTGFRVSGGVIYGPSRQLPFLAESDKRVTS